MRDGMSAMLDAHRIGMPEKGRYAVRPRGYLLNAYRTDCEHAALMRRKDMPAKARATLERARIRTTSELAKKWGIARTSRHMRWIDSAFDRMEALVGAPQNELLR